MPPLVATQLAPKQKGQARARVSVLIHIPKKKHKHRLGSRFISPATKSMSVEIDQNNQSVLSKTVDLTPTSSGCVSTLADVQCTLTLTLAAGAYTASVTTFDGLGGSGAQLSTAQNLPFTITIGSANVIPFTLSGIPAHIVASVAKANAFFVWALDADGNAIVGEGAPSFTAAKTSGPSVASITQPSATSPNTVTVALVSPNPSAGTETIGVTASYANDLTNPCGSAVCTLVNAVTATSTNTQQLFSLNDSSLSLIQGFTVPFPQPTPSPDITLSLQTAFSQPPAAYPLAVDSKGDLFVLGANGNQSALFAYSPPYTAPPTKNSSGIANPAWIATDSHDNAYVFNYSDSLADANITVYAPPYNGTPTATLPAMAPPQASQFTYGYFGLDSSDNLYVVTETGNGPTDYLNVYASSNRATPAYTVQLDGQPSFVKVGAHGVYLFIGGNLEAIALPITSNTPAIATIPPPGVVTAIAEDASGNIFVAGEAQVPNCHQGVCFGYITTSAVSEFTTPISTSETPALTFATTDTTQPSLLFDAAGNLYVASRSDAAYPTGTIDQYVPPFTNASVPNIVTTIGLAAPSALAFAPSTGYSLTLTAAPYSAVRSPHVTLSRVEGRLGSDQDVSDPAASADDLSARRCPAKR